MLKTFAVILACIFAAVAAAETIQALTGTPVDLFFVFAPIAIAVSAAGTFAHEHLRGRR